MMCEAVSTRAQVTHEDHVRKFKLLNQSLVFDDPVKVRGAHAAVDDRAGDAESGSVNLIAAQVLRSLARKFLYDQIESREFLAGKAMTEDRREVAMLLGKQRHVAFGDAELSRRDQLSPF